MSMSDNWFPLLTLRKHASAVTCVKFLSEPGYLISGDQTGHVYIWDLNSSQVIQTLPNLGDDSRSIYEILLPNIPSTDCCSNNEDSVQYPIQSVSQCVVQTRHGVLSLWDMNSCKTPIHSIQTNSLSFAKARLLPFGGTTLSSSSLLCLAPLPSNDKIGLYDLERCSSSSGKPVIETKPITRQMTQQYANTLHSLSNTIQSSSFEDSLGWIIGIDPITKLGSTYIMISNEAFGVQGIYDLRFPNRPITPPILLPEFQHTSVTLAVSKNQSWIGTGDGLILCSRITKSGHVEPGQIVNVHSHSLNDPTKDSLELQKEIWENLHSQSKLGILRFSPCSRMIIAGCWDNTFKYIDVFTRTILRNVTYHTGSITSVDFSLHPSGIAVASRDSKISLWTHSK